MCLLELGKIVELVSDSYLEESLKERDYSLGVGNDCVGRTKRKLP